MRASDDTSNEAPPNRKTPRRRLRNVAVARLRSVTLSGIQTEPQDPR